MSCSIVFKNKKKVETAKNQIRHMDEIISIIIKHGGPPPNMFNEMKDSKKDDGWVMT